MALKTKKAAVVEQTGMLKRHGYHFGGPYVSTDLDTETHA